MKLKIMLCTVGILCLFLGYSVCATETPSVSKGKIVGFVELWSQDMSYLENEISNLKSECGRE